MIFHNKQIENCACSINLIISQFNDYQKHFYFYLGNFSSKATDNDNQNRPKMEKFDKQSLKERLTPLQYHVTQEAGTERPFSGEMTNAKLGNYFFNIQNFVGKYNKCYEKGTYICIVCSQELFNSDNKYDSGCGWPAFNDVLEKGKVTLHSDPSLGNYQLISHHYLCILVGH